MSGVNLNNEVLPDTGDLESYTVLPYNPTINQDDVVKTGFFATLSRLLTTLRSYAAARAWAANQVINPSQNWSGLCQKFARSTVNADAWATTARNAWLSIPDSHKHTDAPRGGSLVYFGNGQPGHAVFVDPLNSAYCFSTDILRSGKVDRVPLRLITDKWGLPYDGWIDWTPSGALNLVPVSSDALHVIAIGGRTPLQRAEVIRQSGMSTARFNRFNANCPAVVPPGYKVKVPVTCNAIYAGRDRS